MAENKKEEKEEVLVEKIGDIDKDNVLEKDVKKEEKFNEKEVEHVERRLTEKKEVKDENKWEEFVIPLRKKFKKTERYRKAPKAIRIIKEFLLRNFKIYERDLNKVKIDKYLNEFIWTRGIKNPPAKVRIRAFVDGEIIRAQLALN